MSLLFQIIFNGGLVIGANVAGGFLGAGHFIAQQHMTMPLANNGGQTQTASVVLIAAPTTLHPLPLIMPGLLPADATPIKFSIKKITPQKKNVAAATPVTTVSAAAPVVIKIAPVIQNTIVTVTARTLLDSATPSFKERRDGELEMTLTSPIGGGKSFSWTLSQTDIGGANGVPPMTAGFSCNPPPDMPGPDSITPEPGFAVRTVYTCEIDLTPKTGADQRLQTRTLTFTSPGGSLVITPASSLNTVLTDDKNVGGFVFTNHDAQPATIRNVTLTVAYNALSTSTTPLVVRFLDPVSDAILADYHIEGLPSDPSNGPWAHKIEGVVIPVTFTVPAGTSKLLPIQVLGVHKLSISGVNPSITVSLLDAATTQGGTKVSAINAQITWTCVFTNEAFDPTATTGPFADGTACRS